MGLLMMHDLVNWLYHVRLIKKYNILARVRHICNSLRNVWFVKLLVQISNILKVMWEIALSML
jgi:hypothetical protein